ncbi:Trm112 family protein [Pseudodesulfovibrio tunisiensis]|uniref:Trm112 family protein n=1 Tax=Pseudodesulfovibrio tunisiensis TaxID=463192 RepID=UPI001FB5272F|nr:Trm112 family protein [Pseudodesulfovibrio tunisiensis]
MTLDKELVAILACPVCKGDLELLPAEDGLKCEACGLVYPVRDEIPIMLADQAVKLEEWKGSR